MHDVVRELRAWWISPFPYARLHRAEMTRDVVGHAVGVLQVDPGHVIQAGKRIVIGHSQRARHAAEPAGGDTTVPAGRPS
jgi:hypothetical protein